YGFSVIGSDGQRLFVVGDQSRGQLGRYDAKSGRFVPFLSGMSAEGVSFSHDAQWVAWVAYPEGALWRSRIDGSQRLQLAFAPMRASNLTGRRTGSGWHSWAPRRASPGRSTWSRQMEEHY